MPEQGVQQKFVANTVAEMPGWYSPALINAPRSVGGSRNPAGVRRHRFKRRDFLLFAACVATASKSVLAASDIPRVGFIGSGFRQASEPLLQAFRDGLVGVGWADGDNILVVDRWADERTERLPSIARELVASDVDLLVTAGTPATLAAQRATAEVPIVLVAVGDPVGLGVVNSLARPGGNATGVSLSSLALIAARFHLLQELIPGMSRVAVIARNDPGLEQRMLDIRTIARRMGLKVVEFVAPTGKSVELAFRWLNSDRHDALYVASGPLGPAKRAEIIELAAASRLPAIYSFRIFAIGGGLMSFGADEGALFRRAAIFVDNILKGAMPADLPVEEPSKMELVINMRTANALGINMPPSLIARADEVIE